MTDHPNPPQQSSEPSKPDEPPRLIEADSLFQGRREVWIEHDGIRYRLRITRRNKLILQK
jgi:hemin uptake protein HemP